MLDGLMLIDAHLHPARLPTLKPAWLDWARQYGQPGWEQVYDAGGSVIPEALDDLLAAEGVDHALLLCEYSPKVTGIQPAEELLPIVKQNRPGSPSWPTSTRTCTIRWPVSWPASSRWAPWA